MLSKQKSKNHFIAKKGIVLFLFAALTILIGSCQAQEVKNSEEKDQGVLLGIFHEGSQGNLAPVQDYEKKLEKDFASIMWFLDWSTSFPMSDVKRVSDAGYMPHITWEPWFFTDTDKISLENILAGEWDAYIEKWASDAAEFGKPMMLRWGHEFNGNWYPWSVAKNGEDPQMYIDAYRKIHDTFAAAGADNVIWIWCANTNSVPNEAWNVAMNAYPGDEYVDWVGIDGYNFSGNESFKNLFIKSYNKFVTEIDKPIMIAEFATGGQGDKKALWVKAMAEDLEKYFPAIRAINWFDINKEMDWRLIVDEKTLQASKDAFSSKYFLSDSSTFTYITENYASIMPSEMLTLIEEAAPAERKKALAAPMSGNWQSSEAYSLVSSDGDQDMKAEIRFAWDNEALYFKAEISDDIPASNNKSAGDIWNGDNIEICLGLDSAADPAREFFNSSDFQIGFSTGSADAGVEPGIWAWGSIGGTPAGAENQLTMTDQGYIIEGKIPWASLKADFTAEAGLELGLDFAVDDADASGDRENQTIWNGDSSFYSNPSQWGILVLQ